MLKSELAFLRHCDPCDYLVCVIICNDINAKAVDPVVVKLIVFARDTGPIDGAVLAHMLLNGRPGPYLGVLPRTADEQDHVL